MVVQCYILCVFFFGVGCCDMDDCYFIESFMCYVMVI